MKSLLKVKNALKAVKPKLPETSAIADLAYLVDVGTAGEDSLVVYVILKSANNSPTPDKKRAIEGRVREALARALDYDVYFRWRTTAEQKEVVTMHGLIDQPVSALR